MVVVDAALGRALGARGADIVLAQHLEHGRARQAHHQGRAAEPDRRGRHGQEQQFAAEVCGRFGIDRDRVEIFDEGHQDQQAEPERRHGKPAETEHAQDVIHAGVLPHRARHAERHAKEHGKGERKPGELGGHRDARQDFIERRPLGDE